MLVLSAVLHPINGGLASVRICTSHDAKLYKELPVQNAVELKFSPLGTFLSTWERPGVLSQAALWLIG